MLVVELVVSFAVDAVGGVVRVGGVIGVRIRVIGGVVVVVVRGGSVVSSGAAVGAVGGGVGLGVVIGDLWRVLACGSVGGDGLFLGAGLLVAGAVGGVH